MPIGVGASVREAVIVVSSGPRPALDALATEARAEGHRFVDRLIAEWANGSNRFDRPGEVLLEAMADEVAAIGGLNCDPYPADGPPVGRLRHVYVRPAFRSRGIGRMLVSALLDRAGGQFERVRLRTHADGAAKLYLSMGFAACGEPHATRAVAFSRQRDG